MAQENIKAVTPIFSEKLGARILAVAEVEFPEKYKTEGCEFTEKQLQEAGLTIGVVDCAWVVTSGLAAKNAEEPILQFNITNPGLLTISEGGKVQKVAVQAYESITTAINKELAAEGTKANKCKFTVALIGR